MAKKKKKSPKKDTFCVFWKREKNGKGLEKGEREREKEREKTFFFGQDKKKGENINNNEVGRGGR